MSHLLRKHGGDPTSFAPLLFHFFVFGQLILEITFFCRSYQCCPIMNTTTTQRRKNRKRFDGGSFFRHYRKLDDEEKQQPKIAATSSSTGSRTEAAIVVEKSTTRKTILHRTRLLKKVSNVVLDVRCEEEGFDITSVAVEPTESSILDSSSVVPKEDANSGASDLIVSHQPCIENDIVQAPNEETSTGTSDSVLFQNSTTDNGIPIPNNEMHGVSDSVVLRNSSTDNEMNDLNKETDNDIQDQEFLLINPMNILDFSQNLQDDDDEVISEISNGSAYLETNVFDGTNLVQRYDSSSKKVKKKVQSSHADQSTEDCSTDNEDEICLYQSFQTPLEFLKSSIDDDIVQIDHIIDDLHNDVYELMAELDALFGHESSQRVKKQPSSISPQIRATKKSGLQQRKADTSILSTSTTRSPTKWKGNNIIIKGQKEDSTDTTSSDSVLLPKKQTRSVVWIPISPPKSNPNAPINWQRRYVETTITKSN